MPMALIDEIACCENSAHMLKTLRLNIAALVLCVISSGCALQHRTPPPEASLYERVGGKQAINAVVVDAIGNISTDKRINPRFINASSSLNQNLVDLLCVRTGGPCKYSGLDMSAAHEGMNIRDDEFDALVDDIRKSLDKFKVADREKAEVLAILNQMRNAVVGH